MAKQTINIGTADKGDGDPLRTAFDKVNTNFSELYSTVERTASTTQAGTVQLDGTTIAIVNGIISAIGSAPLVLDGGSAATNYS